MCARRKRVPEQTLFAFAEEEEVRRREIDAFVAGSSELRRGRRLLQVLETAAALRDFSPYNAVLAALQCPGARCLLSPARWRRYNRVPKRGARPVVVLRPFAPVSLVYDVDDTRVMPQRQDRFALPDGANQVPEAIVNRLLSRMPAWGIGFDPLPTGPAATGEIHVADANAATLTVTVGEGVVYWQPSYVLRTRVDVAPADRLAAMLRGLARLFCHHLRGAYEQGWEDGRRLDETTESLEAASVCWLVSRRCGVGDGGDLPGLMSAVEELPTRYSLDAVIDAVAEIERMLDAEGTVRDGMLWKLSPSFVQACGNVEAKEDRV